MGGGQETAWARPPVSELRACSCSEVAGLVDAYLNGGANVRAKEGVPFLGEALKKVLAGLDGKGDVEAIVRGMVLAQGGLERIRDEGCVDAGAAGPVSGRVDVDLELHRYAMVRKLVGLKRYEEALGHAWRLWVRVCHAVGRRPGPRGGSGKDFTNGVPGTADSVGPPHAEEASQGQISTLVIGAGVSLVVLTAETGSVESARHLGTVLAGVGAWLDAGEEAAATRQADQVIMATLKGVVHMCKRGAVAVACEWMLAAARFYLGRRHEDWDANLKSVVGVVAKATPSLLAADSDGTYALACLVGITEVAVAELAKCAKPLFILPLADALVAAGTKAGASGGLSAVAESLGARLLQGGGVSPALPVFCAVACATGKRVEREADALLRDTSALPEVIASAARWLGDSLARAPIESISKRAALCVSLAHRAAHSGGCSAQVMGGLGRVVAKALVAGISALAGQVVDVNGATEEDEEALVSRSMDLVRGEGSVATAAGMNYEECRWCATQLYNHGAVQHNAGDYAKAKAALRTSVRLTVTQLALVPDGDVLKSDAIMRDILKRVSVLSGCLGRLGAGAGDALANEACLWSEIGGEAAANVRTSLLERYVGLPYSDSSRAMGPVEQAMLKTADISDSGKRRLAEEVLAAQKKVGRTLGKEALLERLRLTDILHSIDDGPALDRAFAMIAKAQVARALEGHDFAPEQTSSLGLIEDAMSVIGNEGSGAAALDCMARALYVWACLRIEDGLPLSIAKAVLEASSAAEAPASGVAHETREVPTEAIQALEKAVRLWRNAMTAEGDVDTCAVTPYLMSVVDLAAGWGMLSLQAEACATLATVNPAVRRAARKWMVGATFCPHDTDDTEKGRGSTSAVADIVALIAKGMIDRGLFMLDDEIERGEQNREGSKCDWGEVTRAQLLYMRAEVRLRLISSDSCSRREGKSDDTHGALLDAVEARNLRVTLARRIDAAGGPACADSRVSSTAPLPPVTGWRVRADALDSLLQCAELYELLGQSLEAEGSAKEVLLLGRAWAAPLHVEARARAIIASVKARRFDFSGAQLAATRAEACLEASVDASEVGCPICRARMGALVHGATAESMIQRLQMLVRPGWKEIVQDDEVKVGAAELKQVNGLCAEAVAMLEGAKMAHNARQNLDHENGDCEDGMTVEEIPSTVTKRSRSRAARSSAAKSIQTPAANRSSRKPATTKAGTLICPPEDVIVPTLSAAINKVPMLTVLEGELARIARIQGVLGGVRYDKKLVANSGLAEGLFSSAVSLSGCNPLILASGELHIEQFPSFSAGLVGAATQAGALIGLSRLRGARCGDVVDARWMCCNVAAFGKGAAEGIVDECLYLARRAAQLCEVCCTPPIAAEAAEIRALFAGRVGSEAPTQSRAAIGRGLNARGAHLLDLKLADVRRRALKSSDQTTVDFDAGKQLASALEELSVNGVRKRQALGVDDLLGLRALFRASSGEADEAAPRGKVHRSLTLTVTLGVVQDHDMCDWLLVTRSQPPSDPYTVRLPLFGRSPAGKAHAAVHVPPSFGIHGICGCPTGRKVKSNHDEDLAGETQFSAFDTLEDREAGALGLVGMLSWFEAVLSQSRSSAEGETAPVEATSSKEAKGAWWARRIALDRSLGRSLTSLEQSWFGAWRFLLAGGPGGAKGHAIRKAAEKAAIDLANELSTARRAGAGDEDCAAMMYPADGVDVALLRDVIILAVSDEDKVDGSLSDAELAQVCGALLGWWPASGGVSVCPGVEAICNAAASLSSLTSRPLRSLSVVAASISAAAASSERLVDILRDLITKLKAARKTCLVRAETALATAKIASGKGSRSMNTGQDQRDGRCPVVMVLHRWLQRLPWECLPCLRGGVVCRMPSAACARALAAGARRDGSASPLLELDCAYYLINPGGDLPGTQREFEDWFRHISGWRGAAGMVPQSRELGATLSASDLFVYMGHGGGDQYIPERNLAQLTGLGGALLMGCSSGMLVPQGRYDPTGVPLAYLLAGSPAVVANLWDVTDRDIDRFSRKLLEEWLGDASGQGDKTKCVAMAGPIPAARGACRLPHLVGAAPVCFGLPSTLLSRPAIGSS